MPHRSMPLRSAGLALLMAMSVPTLLLETPAASAPVEDDASDEEAGVSATHTKTTDRDQVDRPCFPVSVPAWSAGSEGNDYLTGWASVDRTAHSAGLGCQVKGWAPIDACGRTIAAYVATCPDGAFTFTKIEADCYYVLGCREPREASAYRIPK